MIMNTISKNNGIFTFNVQIYFADCSYKKQRIFVGTVHIYRFIPSIPIPFD